MAEHVLVVDNLVKDYHVPGGIGRAGRSVRAVDGVSFSVAKGTTFGIVGESGSGKSSIAKCLLGLESVTDGSIRLNGTEIQDLRSRARKPHRRNIQMVFQMPRLSFDPTSTIWRAVREPLRRLRPDLSRERADERVKEVLEATRVAEEHWHKKPSELSGGQLQRAAIARALGCEPDVVVLDEPTSSLDLSVRGEILGLVRALGRETDAAFVLITHDLEAVKATADDVLVMYRGQALETGMVESLFSTPRHPYTLALLAAGLFDDSGVKLGQPDVEASTVGCRLADRCPLVEEACHTEQPLIEKAEGGTVRCWKVAD